MSVERIAVIVSEFLPPFLFTSSLLDAEQPHGRSTEIPKNAPKTDCENDPHACQGACPEDRDQITRIDFSTSMHRCQLEYGALVC